MSRDSVALLPPSRPLHGFPSCELTAAQPLVRGHRETNGPWWFSSDGGGRFDLTPPRGTCYLAFDERTAIRETVGEALARTGVISEDFAAIRRLSTLAVPHDHVVADTCAEQAADFGLTRELVSMTPYAVPQEWAASFDAIGFTGIQYQTRFTTGPHPNAVGLFGPAGEAAWLTDPNPEAFTAAARRCGFTVIGPPRSVRIVSPPTS
ncbi:RES domain-containing protein [Rhodococcus rhodochrous J3]|uniref:RES domain-containing protein n=1 Tax=Rhodococcus rhodochrous J3 TaxID=903528 RepID=A0ABY1MJA8_RHORH|nr:RES family NAD+ phosphorylase [Rhodococcus rhodochrous]MBF4476518.1 RES family NAD+ phosphorylase [Rhodococcus rhodochrous]MCB8913800.1 RES family NAD+ phosphorylase [Rhodococcus rhodochrous]MCD2099759.1 RES family NAD+ phosphorylase [Rhodococcus rhodochrous]MCD2124053.1 RES family NAD+ phosphorylase [Rhodococcus rhodochrous]MCQ4136863.1 RES family NAD+ phosphorylase [Rhodococcus rhodochrous]